MRQIAFAVLLTTSALFPVAGMAAIKDYGQNEYLRVSKDLPHVENTPWRLVCTMPYNCHFQPSIEVQAEAGKVIAFN